MPDPPKFTFGAPASTSGASSGSLFGTSTGNTPASSSANIFGNTATSGSDNKSSALFGGGSKPSGGFSFGPTTGGASTGGGSSVFGGGGSSTGGTGFGFGQKPADTAQPSSTSAPNSAALMTPALGSAGSVQTSQGGGFFNLGKKDDASQPTSGATTPAASKPAPLSFSTTPAGPPPSASTGIFGGAKPAGGSNLFGGNKEQAASPFTLGSAAPQSGGGGTSGGGLFGNTQGASQPSGGLFGNLGKTSTPAASDAGNEQGKATPQPAPSSKPLFGAVDSQPAQSGTTTKPTFSFPQTAPSSAQAPASSSSGTSNLFGNLNKPTSPLPQTSGTSAPSMFPSLGQSKPDTTTTNSAPTASAAPAPSPGLFGNKDGPTSQAPTSSGPSSSSLFSLGKKPDAAAASGPAPTSAAPTSSAAPGPSLFGGLGAKPAQPQAPSSGTSAAPTLGTAGSTGTTGAPALGASTTGPSPPAASRLAAKSLDEILTLWTTSLTSHQKTFGSMATKISTWDRQLVENTDKISKLYSRTFQAERDTAEVERQLTAVEGEQAELERYLDHYEKIVDEMTARNGGVEGGVDAERERTYRTAERCSQRLTSMSHDLTTMIEEINAASTNLRQTSKSANAQDPLSQIVRVLNGHLAQLQQIDSGAASLQQKVSAAQREVRGLGRNGGIGDEIDLFGRSYLGRD